MMSPASLLNMYNFKLDTTQLLTNAFDEAWAKIIASGSSLADSGNAANARTLLAIWIIDQTKIGEHDADRLVQGALEYMAELTIPRRG